MIELLLLFFELVQWFDCEASNLHSMAAKSVPYLVLLALVAQCSSQNFVSREQPNSNMLPVVERNVQSVHDKG